MSGNGLILLEQSSPTQNQANLPAVSRLITIYAQDYLQRKQSTILPEWN